MKLVEILAREMDKWPEGVECLFQENDGMVSGVNWQANAGFYGSLKPLSGLMLTVAEDQGGAVVTKEDWQAERAKLEGPDWSKAPEGATHWGPETDVYHECWYRKNKGAWECWPCNGVHEWLEASDVCCHEGLLQRPTQQWNGEGLPLVGTVCEALDGNKYVPVTVISHDDGYALCRISLGEYMYGKEDAFRILRTHDQIKAEEREQAILEMERICTEGASCGACLAALYDAGYRKQEAGK